MLCFSNMTTTAALASQSSPAQSGDSTPEWKPKEPIKNPPQTISSGPPNLTAPTVQSLSSCGAALAQPIDDVSKNVPPVHQLQLGQPPLLIKRKTHIPTCGAACTHHSQPSLYKTELCRSYQETGKCKQSSFIMYVALCQILFTLVGYL